MNIVKAITIDPLWAWATFEADKLIENRTWTTKYRGPLVIHAGLNVSRYAEAVEWMKANTFYELPELDFLQADFCGRAIGQVELFDIVPVEKLKGEHEYAIGPLCWMLRNPSRFCNPFKTTGKQGLFEIDLDPAVMEVK